MTAEYETNFAVDDIETFWVGDDPNSAPIRMTGSLLVGLTGDDPTHVAGITPDGASITAAFADITSAIVRVDGGYQVMIFPEGMTTAAGIYIVPQEQTR